MRMLFYRVVKGNLYEEVNGSRELKTNEVMSIIMCIEVLRSLKLRRHCLMRSCFRREGVQTQQSDCGPSIPTAAPYSLVWRRGERLLIS